MVADTWLYDDELYWNILDAKIHLDIYNLGIEYGLKVGKNFYALAWISQKLIRLSTSPASSETIVAVIADRCSMSVAKAYENASGTSLKTTLAVDKRGMHRWLAPHSQPQHLSVITVVHRILFNDMYWDIDKIVWVIGMENPADALLKLIAGVKGAIIQRMFTEGSLVHEFYYFRGYVISKLE